MQTQRRLVGGTVLAALVLGVNVGFAQSPMAANSAGGISGAVTPRALSDSVVGLPFIPPLPRREISRRSAIVLGVVIGGSVGATAGYFLSRDSCEACDYSSPEARAAALGFLAGGLVGGFVAAQNVPPGQSPSSLRATSTQFLSVPRPVLRYQLAVFR